MNVLVNKLYEKYFTEKKVYKDKEARTKWFCAANSRLSTKYKVDRLLSLSKTQILIHPLEKDSQWVVLLIKRQKQM